MPKKTTAFSYNINYGDATTATYSEEELVDMLKMRYDKAFGYLYNNYSHALYGVVLDFVADRDRADDILQDVFINIYRKIDTYDAAKGRLFTWMVNVTRHLAIDELRSKQYRNQQKNVSITEVTEMEETSTMPQIDTIGLHRLIEKIKPKHQEIIKLIYYQGYTSHEIAKQYDIPLGTVKTRLRAALVQLRQFA